MGYAPRTDITGQRFGRLVVLKRLPDSIALCLCDCGQQKEVRVCNLTGSTKSCGCWRNEARRKHGMHKTSEYSTWEHMIQRCTNPNSDAYPNYGGRGIAICQEWRNSFMAFFQYVGAKPGKDYTIERLDVNGNYEPGNVKWLKKSAQSYNRRINRTLTFEGITMPATAWAAKLGMSLNTIRTRLHRGWTDEQVLSHPTSRQGKKPGIY